MRFFLFLLFLRKLSSNSTHECVWLTSDGKKGVSAKELESAIIENGNYDAGVRPLVAKTQSLVAPAEFVSVDLSLQSYVINEQEGSMTARGDFRASWIDERLKYDAPVGNDCPSDITEIPLWKLSDDVEIWNPAPFAVNERDRETSFEDARATWIYPNGTVVFLEYLNVEFECKIHVRKLPFDKHQCNIRMASYSYPADQVIIWGALPMEHIVENVIDRSDTESHAIWDLKKTSVQNGHNFVRSHGITEQEFSVSKLSLHIKRRSRYHFSHAIMPAWLFLLVSWTGFFIDRRIAPARVTIAIMPVLIMRLLLNGVFGRLEQLSYRIFIDEHLTIAMVLSAFCVFHYGFVQIALHNEELAKQRRDVLKMMADRLAAGTEAQHKSHHRRPSSPRSHFLGQVTKTTEENTAIHTDIEDTIQNNALNKKRNDSPLLLRSKSIKHAEPKIRWMLSFLLSRDNSERTSAFANIEPLDSSQQLYEHEGYNPIADRDANEMRRIFKVFDADESGMIDALETAELLRYYGVYIDKNCARDTILNWRFLNRLPIPINRESVVFSFADFKDFIAFFDSYVIGETSHTFLSKPPSLQVDILARFGFIPMCVFIFGIHWASWFGPTSTL